MKRNLIVIILQLVLVFKIFPIPIVRTFHSQVEIQQEQKFIQKNLRTIELAYKRAPYYKDVYPLIKKILYCNKRYISEYIKESFYVICEYLNITTKLIVSSSLNKDLRLKSQDKLISICKLLGATEYYNAYGGRDLYSYTVFRDNGIQLKFLKSGDIKYNQYQGIFQENLSIIDVMMFNSKREIEEMLNNFSIITDL